MSSKPKKGLVSRLRNKVIIPDSLQYCNVFCKQILQSMVLCDISIRTNTADKLQIPQRMLNYDPIPGS